MIRLVGLALRQRPGGSQPRRSGHSTFLTESDRSSTEAWEVGRAYIALYAKLRPKSRPDTDSRDASGPCRTGLLSTSPRLGASRAGPGSSSGGSGPRWSGQESEHTVQVEEPSRRSSAGSARTRHLALDCSRDAQTRVFSRHRGVSRNRSRPHWTKH